MQTVKRTLYIGDVHGCADELEEILDKFGPVEGDALYQTGDVINKGPDSYRALKTIVDNGILTVLGNHEESFLRLVHHPESWREKDRLRIQAIKEVEFFESVISTWPLWRETPHALLVHAGLEPGKTRLEEMDPKVLVSVRFWTDGRPWFESVKWPKRIVFGHWAQLGFVCRPDVIGLDSGCVYGKQLTAWCPEESRFYTVDAHKVYSPVNKKFDAAGV